MKERAFKYIDVYLNVNSQEGLKYLRRVIFLNDRELLYKLAHYYTGSAKFMGLNRCAHILDNMQKLVSDEITEEPNLDMFRMYYYLLLLAFNESFKEFFRIKQKMGDVYKPPDYVKEKLRYKDKMFEHFEKVIGEAEVPPRSTWSEFAVNLNFFIEKEEKFHMTLEQREALFVAEENKAILMKNRQPPNRLSSKRSLDRFHLDVKPPEEKKD